MKNRRKMTICLLAVAAVLSLGIVQSRAAGSSARNDSAIVQSIKEKQRQVDNAQKEKNGLKQNLSNVQQIQKGLESKKNDLNNYLLYPQPPWKNIL